MAVLPRRPTREEDEMHPTRRPTIRAAIAELMTAVLNDLAERDGTPKIGPIPDVSRW